MSIDFVISTTPLHFLYISYALPFAENPSSAQQGTMFGPTFLCLAHSSIQYSLIIEGMLFHERKNHIFCIFEYLPMLIFLYQPHHAQYVYTWNGYVLYFSTANHVWHFIHSKYTGNAIFHEPKNHIFCMSSGIDFVISTTLLRLYIAYALLPFVKNYGCDGSHVQNNASHT
jgi:hypothetical protein